MTCLNFKTIVKIILASFVVIPSCSSRRGPAENQLLTWSKKHKSVPALGINYQPVPSLTATIGIGSTGPLLHEDVNFQAYLANVANDNIPERIVHAKGAGAKGYFIVTHSMAKYTKAAVFSKVGLKSRVVVRFSTSTRNDGSADTFRDRRGLAIKFETTEGMYDLTMVNMPIFPVRDVILFPEFIRSRRRNPKTHLSDLNMFFDYTTLRRESTFSTFLTFSNLSYFQNYRHMESFSINSFKWTGGTLKTNEEFFVRYHLRPELKPITSSHRTYTRRAGTDPDYMVRDLYNAIARKNYPTYTLYAQIFTGTDSKNSKFDMFDPTKILFVADFPLVPIGKLVLTKNPTNFFNEVNQAAFNPGNLVPGIQLSPDRLLQGRFMTYLDAQSYRLGSNFNQLPINRPKKVKGQTYFRNGFMNIDGNGHGGPDYYPNTFNGPYIDPKSGPKASKIDGARVAAYDVQNDNFQIDRYWREILTPKQRRDTIEALAKTLAQASEEVQERTLKVNWDPINDEVKTMIRAALSKARTKLNRRKVSLTKQRSCVKKFDATKLFCNKTKTTKETLH